MPGDADTHRTSAAALVPTAIVAAAVLVIALIVSASRTGTIVVQRITWTATGGNTGSSGRPLVTAITAITETSGDGTEVRDLTSASTQPGFQELSMGDKLELYDPRNDTIYVTSEEAWQRALAGQAGAQTTGRAHTSNVYLYAGPTPGHTSVFAQELRAGNYRLGPKTTIDGRNALELIPTQRTVRLGSAIREIFEPVYVTPRTFDPIEAIIRVTAPGQRTSTVERWSTYRVLSATSANQWRVSLTAQHPHARVIHSASGYLQASDTAGRSEASSSS